MVQVTSWLILSVLLMVYHIEGKAVASPNPDPKPKADPKPQPEAKPDVSFCGGTINPWLTQNRISSCGDGLIGDSLPLSSTYQLGSYGFGSQLPSYYGGGVGGLNSQPGFTPYFGVTGISGSYPSYSSSYPSYSSSYPSYSSSYPSYSSSYPSFAGSSGISGSYPSSYPDSSFGLTYPGQSFGGSSIVPTSGLSMDYQYGTMGNF